MLNKSISNKYFQIIIVIASFLWISSCGNDEAKNMNDTYSMLDDSSKFTDMQWLDSLVDIGKIKVGSKSEIQFRFKNTGSKPLYIIEAKPGCGCTVTDYPKKAIEPGNSGEIKAIFDTKNKAAEAFHKNILVTANTQKKRYYLYFFGKITDSSEVDTKDDTLATRKKIAKKIDKKDLILIPIKK